MKLLLLLSLLCGAGLPVAGQVAGPRPGQAAVDTAQYGRVRKEEKYLALPAVAETTTTSYFRLNDSEGHILDLWQQNGRWAGQLTLWVADADEALLYHPYHRLYKRQYALAQEQADSAARLLLPSQLLELPNQKYIKGWSNGADGYSFTVQYRDSSGYKLADYWGASYQHGIPEAALVEKACTELLATTNYKTVFRAFATGIPFPEYTTYGSFVYGRTVTAADYWQHQREVARFLRRQRRRK